MVLATFFHLPLPFLLSTLSFVYMAFCICYNPFFHVFLHVYDLYKSCQCQSLRVSLVWFFLFSFFLFTLQSLLKQISPLVVYFQICYRLFKSKCIRASLDSCQYQNPTSASFPSLILLKGSKSLQGCWFGSYEICFGFLNFVRGLQILQ